MKYVLYAIGLKHDLFPPYDQCYIGVTNNPVTRWARHIRSKYTIGQFIRSNSVSFDENFKVLMSASKDECFNKEHEYRPRPHMGLNEAIGGKGGHTFYSKERNAKISMANKGRKIPWIRKIIDARRSYDGAGNPNAKRWIVVDPKGNMYDIHGNLPEFCNQHQIMVATLRSNTGKPVPPLKDKSYGGFRPKSETELKFRHNTTGWTLIMCEEK